MHFFHLTLNRSLEELQACEKLRYQGHILKHVKQSRKVRTKLSAYKMSSNDFEERKMYFCFTAIVSYFSETIEIKIKLIEYTV